MTWDPDDDIATIQAKSAAAEMPFPGLLEVLLRVYTVDLVDHMHAAGFGDLRPAHNAVFANVPAEGVRLTTLAAKAGMTKQAMGELVGDLEGKGYVERVPDPSDGRAKLIVFDDRGWKAVPHARQWFESVDRRFDDVIGDDAMAQLRGSLEALVASVLAHDGDSPPS